MERKKAILVGSHPLVKKPKDLEIVIPHGTQVEVEEVGDGLYSIHLEGYFPKDLFLFESGINLIAIGMDYPRDTKVSLKTVKFTDMGIELSDWTNVEVAFVDKIGDKAWILMNQAGDRFYYYYTAFSSEENDYKYYFGKLQGSMPKPESTNVKFSVLKHVPKVRKSLKEEDNEIFSWDNPEYSCHDYITMLTDEDKLCLEEFVFSKILDVFKLGETDDKLLFKFFGYNENEELCYVIAEVPKK